MIKINQHRSTPWKRKTSSTSYVCFCFSFAFAFFFMSAFLPCIFFFAGFLMNLHSTAHPFHAIWCHVSVLVIALYGRQLVLLPGIAFFSSAFFSLFLFFFISYFFFSLMSHSPYIQLSLLHNSITNTPPISITSKPLLCWKQGPQRWSAYQEKVVFALCLFAFCCEGARFSEWRANTAEWWAGILCSL